MLELLQRIPKDPAVGCAMPILRIEQIPIFSRISMESMLTAKVCRSVCSVTLTSMPKRRQRAHPLK
ncbi:hypothetical protein [Bradyrhizobium sp. CCBAU 11386]|uniref:hypothetical protein n=1 Tax=Bradyrhizobium sp. CCBAU 11386 TaxID=1630837 RepID=UPI002304761C|nr:hypothetical protein [Bradyrhizobium sp. CCBAU 11386]